MSSTRTGLGTGKDILSRKRRVRLLTREKDSQPSRWEIHYIVCEGKTLAFRCLSLEGPRAETEEEKTSRPQQPEYESRVGRRGREKKDALFSNK